MQQKYYNCVIVVSVFLSAQIYFKLIHIDFLIQHSSKLVEANTNNSQTQSDEPIKLKLSPQLSPKSNQKSIAIIVPYRNRPHQIEPFVKYMQYFLSDLNLFYKIIITEQSENKLFNRGKLLNIGYLEAKKQIHDFDCYTFHDIDIFPKMGHCNYTCDNNNFLVRQPKALAIYISRWNYRLVLG